MPAPVRCPEKNALEIEHDGKQFGAYVATVPVTHTLDDVLADDYFGRKQARSPSDRLLRPGDFIDVRPADWSWYVRLMVRGLMPNVDKLITAPVVGPVTFDVGVLPAGWSMQFAGIEKKWTIFFNDVEKDARFVTAEEALRRIRDLAGEDEPETPRRKGRKPAEARETEPA